MIGMPRRKFLATAAMAGLGGFAPSAASAQSSRQFMNADSPMVPGAVGTEDAVGEAGFGNEHYENLIAQCGGRYRNGAAQAALKRFAQPLFRASRRSFGWDIALTGSLEVLAAALPGGKLIVTRGLLSYIPHPWELAAVIGHEMGHAELSHALKEQQDDTRKAQIAKGATDLAFQMLQQFGGQKVQAVANQAKQFETTIVELETAIAVALGGYSPEHEVEADAYILTVFAASGLPAEAASHVWHRLLRLYPADAASSSLFSSHPEMVERIARLEEKTRGAAPGAYSRSRDFDELKTYVPTRVI